MIFDVLAVVLGILYTMRKVRVRRVEADDYPRVSPELFEAWQTKELGAYTLGSSACFIKLFADIGVRAYDRYSPLAQTTLFVVGFSLFLAWVIALLAAALIGSSARKRREELGIELRPPRTEASEH